MKAVFIISAVLVASALARPQTPGQAYIVRYDNDNNGYDNYNFNVETSDGFRHRSVGELRQVGEDQVLVVTGEYSYVGPDGVTYTVQYLADENGFRANGDHIPPAANTNKVGPLGIPSAALASLSGGGLG